MRPTYNFLTIYDDEGHEGTFEHEIDELDDNPLFI